MNLEIANKGDTLRIDDAYGNIQITLRDGKTLCIDLNNGEFELSDETGEPFNLIPKEIMSPAGAVMGFVAWLTTRDKEIKMSGHHDSSEPCNLVREFISLNGLGDIRNNYNDYLKHPKEPKLVESVRSKDFVTDLTDVINKHNGESVSNTPDFILARYLIGCLNSYNITVQSVTKHNQKEVRYIDETDDGEISFFEKHDEVEVC